MAPRCGDNEGVSGLPSGQVGAEAAGAGWALGWLRKRELQTPGPCKLCMNLSGSFPRCQESSLHPAEICRRWFIKAEKTWLHLKHPARTSYSFLTLWQLIRNTLFCSFRRSVSGFIFLLSFLFRPSSNLSFPTRNPLQLQRHSSLPILPALHHWGWHLGWV